VFDEDANRCLMLNTDERSEQTRRVVRRLGSHFSGAGSAVDPQRVVLRHHALQRLLRPCLIVVPFAERLADLFPCDRVEARRAFSHLLGMIQTSALMHQRQRPIDAEGRLVAQPADYQLARYLLSKPLARLLGDALSDPARRFYEQLAGKWPVESFKSTDAKNLATSSKSAVYGWLADLHDAGVLEVIEEGRGRKATTWKLTGNLPVDGAALALPTVEALFGDMAKTQGYKPQTPVTIGDLGL
jgi:hypothetical protein